MFSGFHEKGREGEGRGGEEKKIFTTPIAFTLTLLLATTLIHYVCNDFQKKVYHCCSFTGITEWLKLEEISGGHLTQSPWLKHSHLAQVAWDHIPASFEDLQGGRLYSLSGHHAPVLSHPHSAKTAS